jgi:DNA primase
MKYKALNKTQEVVPHKHLLYGEHLVVGDSIAVVEGEFDAIAGGSGFVGTFGTAVTPEQLHRMASYKHVYLCFDSDSAGRHASARISNALAVLGGDKVNVYDVVLVSKKKDMAEHDVDELISIRKQIFS